MNNPKTFLSLAALAVLLVVLSPGAQAAVGAFQFISGEVSIAAPGQPARAAIKDGVVNAGDVVTTADNAMTQIRMIDGAILALRANTQMRIEEYHATRTAGQKLLNLVYGGLRALSRSIRRDSDGELRVRTVTVVIGVRGTDHEVYHVRPQGGPPGARPGTYDRVYRGGTYMLTDGGRLDVDEKQVGYAESKDRKPVLLDIVPEFLAQAPARLPVKLAARDDEGGLMTADISGLPGAYQPFPTQELPTPPAVMQAIGGVMTFSNIISQSLPVTETGAVGGGVTAFSTSINFSTLTMTGFNLTVLDAASRTWTGSSAAASPINASGAFVNNVFVPTCTPCAGTPIGSTISMVVQGDAGGRVQATYNLQTTITFPERVSGTVTATR